MTFVSQLRTCRYFPAGILMLALSVVPASGSDLNSGVTKSSGDLQVEIGRRDEGIPLIATGDASIFANQGELADAPRILITVPETGSANTPRQLQDINSFRQQLSKLAKRELQFVVVPVPAGLSFPPTGSAYNTKGQRTAAAIWRAVAWTGTDIVIEFINEPVPAWSETSLANAVKNNSVAGYGKTHSVQLPVALLATPISKWTVEQKAKTGFDEVFPAAVKGASTSPLRIEFQSRQSRTPHQVAEQMTKVYGHDLKKVMYQPALAIIARQEFAALTGDKTVKPDVEKILTPWLENTTAKADPNGSVVSGHLVFVDWANRTGDPRAIELIKKAVSVGFDEAGNPLPSMPMHHEMSDAVFMGTPMLAAAARLTGDTKYLDQLVRHFEFIKGLCLRPDGIYRSSPLSEAAWGRGNGFPMLGLSLALTELETLIQDPKQSPALVARAKEVHTKILPDFQAHAKALLKHQDLTGAWRQVIDEPSAYRELTATCMLGFAMQRGVNRGWLSKEEFSPAIDRAWNAVLIRAGANGHLLDVCTGTGKQKDLQGFFDREAILGIDERGGAMVLIFTIERCKTAAAQ
ncbi:glycoside hydrolase family 88 protein [Planctomicrobium sp. SH527]|uniref:glycoside hydrolase family 88 protein n=1 Tax=Planctomicrobium sp. SH527 TaxID=3448123 RepID=UPI003F5B9536